MNRSVRVMNTEHGWMVIVGVEPDKPKEIKNIEFISLNALENQDEGILELEKDMVENKKFLITKEDKTKLLNNKIDLSFFGEQKTEIDRL